MGVQGIIGWYVPGWMADQYPDITDWNNLNKYAELFKTSESGDKGQFLGADPTFVQYDEALITNLGLNFKDVFSGSEAATITAFQAADKNQTPLIGYFYDPQWLQSEIKLVKVNLPAYTPGCDADLKKVACDYPSYTLNKIVRTAWLDEGGAAQQFIKNFNWTNADQNQVADLITNGGMSDAEAAKVWIDGHPETRSPHSFPSTAVKPRRAAPWRRTRRSWPGWPAMRRRRSTPRARPGWARGRIRCLTHARCASTALTGCG